MKVILLADVKGTGKKNDVVEQTLKDYNLNRSNLIKPEKPIPEYNKNIKPVELEYIDKDSSYSINEINNNNKKKILNQSKKEENEEKENNEINVNKSITQK